MEADPENMKIVMIVGASHITRLVGGLAEHGLNIVNPAKPGRTLNKNTASELKSKTQKSKTRSKRCFYDRSMKQ
jgi:hypothetical protein